MNIFRADFTNVGDAFSPPFIYFPFKDKRYVDILNLDHNTKFDNGEAIIIGGGGLGREFFKNKIEILINLKKTFGLKIIGWGLGYDFLDNKSHDLISNKYNLISEYFDNFNLIGTRVYLENDVYKSNYLYVPCASCMHDAFYSFRKKIKKNQIGVYSHKRVLLNHLFPNYDHMTNEGMDLPKVLNFLSSYEFILTNSYHGVYWATLLGAKVICFPSKSGLYSFKYKPTYSLNYKINDQILESAFVYKDSLDESRDINFDFYKKIYDFCDGI